MSTEIKGVHQRNGKGAFLADLRRLRFGRILLACCTLTLAAVLLAVYVDRDLLRHMTKDQLRQFLERDLGLELHMARSRVRLVPLRVVVEGVKLRRQGEPWTLTVEETEISVALYTLLFHRTGALKVSLLRPRYFQHTRADGGDGSAFGPPGRRAGTDALSLGLTSLVAGDLPLRALKIEEGEVWISRGEERRLTLEGIRLSAALSGGRLMGNLDFQEGVFRESGIDWELGEVSLEMAADAAGLTVRKSTAASPLGEGWVKGTLGYDGALSLDTSLSCVIGEVTERLGKGRPLEGKIVFRGEVSGTFLEPRISGRLALTEPVFQGKRWPGLKGTVSSRGRYLEWKELTAPAGAGAIRSSGTLDLRGPRPQYTLEAQISDLDPARLPFLRETFAAAVDNLNGRIRWEGSGIAGGDVSGKGSLEAGFVFEGWRPGEIRLSADAALEGDLLEVTRFEASSGSVEVNARGSYRVGDDLSAWIEAETDDLADVISHWEIADYDGRVSLEGELSFSPAGVIFRGPVHWEEGRALLMEGFDVTADIRASSREVTVDSALMIWKGGEIRGDGTVDLEDGKVDVITAWQDLPAGGLARLLGVEKKVEGTIGGYGRLLGDWSSPRLTGRFQGQQLRYGDLFIEKAAGNVAFADGDLQLNDASLQSGGSAVDCAGLLQKNRSVDGTFESPDFNLGDFIPGTAVSAAGLIEGRLDGTIDRPLMRGRFRADLLKYEAWSLKGGEGAFEYSDGSFSIRGHLTERMNGFHITVVPAGDWPFEALLTLDRFSPELAKEGFASLPVRMRDAMEGLSFLAVGTLSARGRLRDVNSISADLDLETVWVYTRGQTLQNLTPLHFSWKEEELSLEPFTLAGEDYRLSISGRGGVKSGWDLILDGEVNLSMFQRFWDELESVDAPGNVVLRVFGPWETPDAGGRIIFRGGSVKLRSLPDPIVNLRGEGELAERAFSLSDFSGVMGKGAFIAGGTYDFDSRRVDALVEGSLDLALFQKRIPIAREMKGPLQARLSLSGPVEGPKIFGEARLEGAEVLLKSMPERITELTGTVVMEEGRMELRDLSGNMGSGEVTLSGVLDWREDPAAVDFAFTGRRLTVVVEETAKALLDSDLTLSGDFDTMKLSGEVTLLKVRYFREFKDKFKGFPLLAEVQKKGEEGRGGPDFGNLELDLAVTAADRLWIINSMAELENSIDLHIGGTVTDPLLDGEIRLLRGTVTYFNRTFTLFSGRIFNVPPGIHPILEAQAEVAVNDVVIHLLLEGPLGKPSLQLTSVPPLSQEDLYTLLTVGFTRADLEEEESEALAIGAALVFTTPLIEEVGEQARGVPGVEVFQVEPTLGEERGGAKVTVGTKLSDRLFMSASQNVGVTEDQQVQLEYQLFDYISVLGEQLQRGIYRLDLVIQLDFN